MSADKKKVPLIALSILITIPVTVTITYGITSGLFAQFFGLNEGEFPLINGTIVGTDNKTYQILVSSIEQKPNLTLINTAVLDSQNKTYHVQIGPKAQPIPEPPVVCPPDSKLNVTTGKCDPIVIPNPEPPTCPPGQFYNTTSKQCQLVVVQPPIPPTPPVFNQTLKVVVVADIEEGTSGNAVFNRIKTENPTNVFVLGDLGYDDNLAWFKSTYGTLGNKVNCVLGNHESANEDGTSSLETESKAYCGNNFYMKKGPHLFLFFNTNSDLVKAATETGKLLQNPTFMTGIKNVFIESHKGCAVPPNTHHAVEIKTFCDAVKAKIPSTVKQYWDSAHNHVMSASADGVYKQSGAGGRSHYECGTSTAFPFCNNSSYGYLIYTIKPDGTVNFAFKDYNGVVKYSK